MTEDEYSRRTRVSLTRSGLILLIIGLVLSWIPVVDLVGGLLVLIGAILIVLGREVFGAAHSRNVLVATLLYFIAVFATFVLLVIAGNAILDAFSLPPTRVEAEVTSAFTGFMLGGLALGLLTGIAAVLFLYELLDTNGLILVVGSFFSRLFIQVFVYAAVMYQLPHALAALVDAYPLQNVGALRALYDQMNLLAVLTVIPDFLAAAAAYVALSRIDNEKIPRRSPRRNPAPIRRETVRQP